MDKPAYIVTGLSPYYFGKFGTQRPRLYSYRRRTKRGANAMAERLRLKGYTGIAISIEPIAELDRDTLRALRQPLRATADASR